MVAILFTYFSEFKRLVEYNAPLRAAAVVSAAGFHVSEDFHKATIKNVAALISESENKITTMSRLLMDMVREDNPLITGIPKLTV
jgi:hypothetical protein